MHETCERRLAGFPMLAFPGEKRLDVSHDTGYYINVSVYLDINGGSRHEKALVFPMYIQI